MRYPRWHARFARTAWLSVLGLLLLTVLAVNGAAQSPPGLRDMADTTRKEAAPTVAEKTQVLKVLGSPDDYDRGVPRTSVAGFLRAARKGDYERAAKYLDLRGMPLSMKDIPGPELARQFKIILDRTLWIDLELLSIDPRGHQDDGLPPSQDLLGQIETKSKKYNLLMQQVRLEDGIVIWKVSNMTVAAIPELYGQVGYGPIGEYLSRKLPEVEFLGSMLWQHVGAVLLMVFCIAAVYLPTWLAVFLLVRRGTDKMVQTARFIRGPLRLLLIVLLYRSLIDLVHPTVAMRAGLRAALILIIAVTWTMVRLTDIFLDYQMGKVARSGQTSAVALFKPLKIVSRIVIVIIAVLVWLDNMGFSITTIVASIGVGGIAVALAAQRTFEDLIGTAVIFLSQPVRVGDFGRFGSTLGTVEEIGLRATRIRTLGNTVITVSNSEFSRMPLESFTAREKMWYHPRIGLPYETDRETVRTIIDRVGSFLRSDPRIFADTARIRFVEMGSYALNLDVFAYVNEQDYARYLAVAEELNFAIMEIVEEAGARLALPSQELYLDPGGNRAGGATGAGLPTIDDAV